MCMSKLLTLHIKMHKMLSQECDSVNLCSQNNIGAQISIAFQIKHTHIHKYVKVVTDGNADGVTLMFSHKREAFQLFCLCLCMSMTLNCKSNTDSIVDTQTSRCERN